MFLVVWCNTLSAWRAKDAIYRHNLCILLVAG